ncbi:MAG: sugar phosphate isomerase/epimerase, partial [Promicromonosporaceae bacterium]|nr:sugar phosphate isomerase/epimerase [Promicromonosporaceae bacterium]
MLIGVRAHDFGSGTFAEFDGILARIKATGYDAVQLAPAKSITEIPSIAALTKDQVLRLKEMLDKHSIKVAVLGCYLDFTA